MSQIPNLEKITEQKGTEKLLVKVRNDIAD